MAKQTTRDAALSRLFGNTAEEKADEAGPATGDVTAARTGRGKRVKSDAPRPEPRAVAGRGVAEPPSAAPNDEQGPSGYIGLGRYTRADGVVERITPYVRPDQAEALRLAVARKNDPRGTDVSQIIQTLLDEAGYSA